MNSNIFSALSKPGLGAEDYLTEGFAFLLRLLLERVPSRGLVLTNQLSGLPQGDRFKRPGSVIISTQVIVDEGRPDIEIRDELRLVYVEVKHDAPLGVRQLERYLSELEAAPFPATRLALLTRSRVSARDTTLAPNDYHHACWYEIYNWLSEEEVHDEVCQYFIPNFLRFLEEKQMSMEKVPQEYSEGVPALVKLTSMMEASIPEAMPNAYHRRTAGWGWRGFNIDGYFYGVRPARPLLVVYESNMGNSPTYKRHLELECVGFFSMSKDEQFECLVDFLRQASEGETPNP